MSTSYNFRKGQVLKFRGAYHHNLILEDPSTCTYQDKPAYCLLSAGSNNPFCRTQEETENGQWYVMPDSYAYQMMHHFDKRTIEQHNQKPPTTPLMRSPMFPVDSQVRHKKTGGIYVIKIDPAVGRLESTSEPAYSYMAVEGGVIWHRSKSEMEDGRFELVKREIEKEVT